MRCYGADTQGSWGQLALGHGMGFTPRKQMGPMWSCLSWLTGDRKEKKFHRSITLFKVLLGETCRRTSWEPEQCWLGLSSEQVPAQRVV